MKIQVLVLGKNKDRWLDEAIDEYLKRLRPYHQIEFQLLADVSIKKAGNAKAVALAESELILKAIQPGDILVLLDEKGKQYDSIGFSEFLTSLSLQKRVVFVIGGVYGTADILKEKADTLLSLSSLTFTHRLSRLILLEQIYRATMISINKPYHI